MYLFEQSDSEYLWCEKKCHQYFQEPINSVSGLVFVYVFYLLKKDIKESSIQYLINTVLAIGISTIMYHSTMFNIFRTMDQITILLLLFGCICQYFNKRQKIYEYTVYLIIGLLLPFFLIELWFINFLLIFVGVVMTYMSTLNLRILRPDEIWGLRYIAIGFIVSMFFWFFDRMCIYHLHTHWIFHIIIAAVAYKGINWLYTINNPRYIILGHNFML